MTAFRYWLATLSVFALGTATQSLINTADAKVTLAEVERACDLALAKNTVEALESFLHKYPPGKYRKKVACYALALDALNDFGNERGNDPSDRHKPSDGGGGGYGS